jgi:hypothetical protein
MTSGGLHGPAAGVARALQRNACIDWFEMHKINMLCCISYRSVTDVCSAQQNLPGERFGSCRNL